MKLAVEIFCYLVITLGLQALGDNRNPCTELALRLAADGDPANVTRWLESEEAMARHRLQKHISPWNARPGFVAAAISAHLPYEFHWPRDAGLVGRAGAHAVRRFNGVVADNMAYQMVYDAVEFTRHIQAQPTDEGVGLGQAKYYPDGTAYRGPWGHPQNDGPAQRAIFMVGEAHRLVSRNQFEDPLLKEMYRPVHINEYPSVIKVDADYIATNWDKRHHDIWEDVKGLHFNSLILIRRALLDTARLAVKMNDPGAAVYYRQVAKEIELAIDEYKFWDPDQRIIRATLDMTLPPHMTYKPDLDSAVILGVNHAVNGDGFYSAADSRVLATFSALRRAFQVEYPVNHHGFPVPAIGRHVGDTYDGYAVGRQGNPWPHITDAFGEFHNHAAIAFMRLGHIKIDPLNLAFFEDVLGTSIHFAPGTVWKKGDTVFKRVIFRILQTGDLFLLRTKLHANPDGTRAEQINRENGYMQGAPDLAWGNAGVLSAIEARRIAWALFSKL